MFIYIIFPVYASVNYYICQKRQSDVSRAVSDIKVCKRSRIEDFKWVRGSLVVFTIKKHGLLGEISQTMFLKAFLLIFRPDKAFQTCPNNLRFLSGPPGTYKESPRRHIPDRRLLQYLEQSGWFLPPSVLKS